MISSLAWPKFQFRRQECQGPKGARCKGYRRSETSRFELLDGLPSRKMEVSIVWNSSIQFLARPSLTSGSQWMLWMITQWQLILACTSRLERRVKLNPTPFSCVLKSQIRKYSSFPSKNWSVAAPSKNCYYNFWNVRGLLYVLSFKSTASTVRLLALYTYNAMPSMPWSFGKGI